MSTAVVSAPVAAPSPRSQANIAGAFYLLTFITSGVMIFADNRIVVAGDAAATAANVMAHSPLLQWRFAAELLATASYVAVTALFYPLFKPVNRTVSLLAAFFSLTGCAVGAFGSFFDLAPLAVLGGAPYLRVFNPQQLQAMAYLSFKLHAQLFNVGIVFFGFYCLLIGYLIFRSRFLPRILGILMAIAGAGWLTFLVPQLATSLAPFNMLPGIVGEGSLTVWLLVIGVNVQRWTEQAAEADLLQL